MTFTTGTKLEYFEIGDLLGAGGMGEVYRARDTKLNRDVADTWAFGCVAYEMLTGRQVFGGETLTDIIASVMKGDPDWSRLPAATPSTLRSLLRQCLNKQANHRLHEIADARIAVEEALTDLPTPLPRAKARDWRWTVLGFATFLLIGAVIGFLATRKPLEIRDTMRFQMSLGRGEKLVGSITSVRPSGTAIAIHPNGKMLVFNGDAKDSPPQLYARELAQSEAIPIPGTQRGIGPFFSPDGQWIGFFSNGQIKKVPVAGGPPVVICDVSKGNQGLFGASWAEDGTIYFSDEGSGISKVPSFTYSRIRAPGENIVFRPKEALSPFGVRTAANCCFDPACPTATVFSLRRSQASTPSEPSRRASSFRQNPANTHTQLPFAAGTRHAISSGSYLREMKSPKISR